MKFKIENKKTKEVFYRTGTGLDAMRAELIHRALKKSKVPVYRAVAEDGIENFEISVDGGFTKKPPALKRDEPVKIEDPIPAWNPDGAELDPETDEKPPAVGFGGKVEAIKGKSKKKK